MLEYHSFIKKMKTLQYITFNDEILLTEITSATCSDFTDMLQHLISKLSYYYYYSSLVVTGSYISSQLVYTESLIHVNKLW